MNPIARRLIATWIVGVIGGTLVIGASSPLFVRSYLPLAADTLRGVWTLPAGQPYRWRSEGYAETRIGPHGMPGKAALLPPRGDRFRVALWGDSQAEGVCVADPDKIFAQAERISGGRLEVLPLARSGEDAADWLTQMPAVETELGVELHLLLLVDLPDLLPAVQAPLPPPSQADVERADAAIAARLPAFMIQAARHLLTEADESTPRRLRFAIGPQDPVAPVTAAQAPSGAFDWEAPLSHLRATSRLPIVLLYAPKLPQIIQGRTVLNDPDNDAFGRLRAAAGRHGLRVVDARAELRESAQQGAWPHGFHNGQLGCGHLNATGNRIVAAQLVAAVEQALADLPADAAER